MLRDFEEEIARITLGSFVHLPNSSRLELARRLGLGTRYSGLRCLLSRRGFELDADVLWVVMMGPESWELDIHPGWDRRVGFKVLYLFDTMERQIPSIRRVLNSTHWDLTVTSFSGAVPFLEAATQRKWFAVPQGVKLQRFSPADMEKRLIEFCAYGRRVDRVHKSVQEFCTANGMYYDYTTRASLQPDVSSQEQYKQYAWHVRHSIFNFCWPVEMTHPDRVHSFSPITCRWFEGAASGSVLVGRAPADPGFRELFGDDLVVELDPDLGADDLRCVLARLWNHRMSHLERARERYLAYSSKWSWDSRVHAILKLMNEPALT